MPSVALARSRCTSIRAAGRVLGLGKRAIEDVRAGRIAVITWRGPAPGRAQMAAPALSHTDLVPSSTNGRRILDSRPNHRPHHSTTGLIAGNYLGLRVWANNRATRGTGPLTRPETVFMWGCMAACSWRVRGCG